MVFNGRVKTGNVAGDLRAIPVTSESAGRRPKSGYLMDSRKWLVSVSGGGDEGCHTRSGTRHMNVNTGKSEARTRYTESLEGAESHPGPSP